MPVPVAPIAASAAALLGVGALTAALVLPPVPPPQPRVWMDQPAGAAVMLAGDLRFDLHGTGAQSVTQLRIQITQDGAELTTLTDTSLDVSPGGPPVLAAGAVLWKGAGAGSYILRPYALSDGAWLEGEPVALTVVAVEGAPVDEPWFEPEPEYTEEPFPEETEEPFPDDPEDPEYPEDPDQPDPGPVDPDPVPPTTAPQPPAATPPVGRIQRLGDEVANESDFIVTYQPQAAFVDVQVQVVSSGTAMNPNGSWASYGCSTPTGSAGDAKCRVHTFTPGSSLTRWAYYRAVITANGLTTYAYGASYWTIPVVVH
ncbi:MAG: hypothetical protein KF727_05635 [Microbacteriaceae bacterium]|nr:hypothetical protein [Microbacteriaceae bacterium]